MLKIIQRRKVWYLLSALLIVPGIISLFVWGLRMGIDFSGGSLLEVKTVKKNVTTTIVEDVVSQEKVDNIAIQNSGIQRFIIRYRKADDKKSDDSMAKKITADLTKKIGDTKLVRFENVGPVVSKSLIQKSITSVIIASILLIIYIAWAFRGVPSSVSSWKLGIFAIVALLHDLLFVVGAFSILGHFFPIFEVNTLFITALLTTLGYSVNDTIIIYDRTRENLRRMPGKTLEDVSNAAVNQTLARSINTSLTMILVLLTLIVLGGSTLISFATALLLGSFIGTYSSIFVASPLLVTFQSKRPH